MGRKRNNAVKGVIHPLRDILGVYMRMRRNSINLSSDEVAQWLNISPTFYRVIESGRVPLSSDSALRMVHMLRNNGVYVDFSSLATFLLAIAFVEQTSAYSLRSLGKIPDLKEFAVSVADYDQYKRGSREQNKFLESVAYPAVCYFLETSPGERAKTRPYLLLDDVSPGGVEVLQVLHRSLQGRSFVGEV